MNENLPEASSAPAGRKAGGRSVRFQRQRKRIIDLATPILNEKGVAGMTLLEIAQGLDLTTTSISYYFRYKEQLAAAVFEDSLSRLLGMVREAARAPTPRERVARYIHLHFDHVRQALRGTGTPLAILSEIRTLEGSVRQPLIEQYQGIVRELRNFFGEVDTESRRLLFTARAHILNEALFWSVLWLRQYALGDFDNVQRRFQKVLERGIAAPGSCWEGRVADSHESEDRAGPSAFLRVATCLINDIGYKGASVDRIMGALNLSKGTFYHHLDTKDDLILQCFRNSYRRLRTIQASVYRQDASIWDNLADGIASALALQFAGEYPLLRSTALQAVPGPVRALAVDRANRTVFWLGGILVEGMEEGSIRLQDPIVAAHLIFSAVNAAYDLRSWAKRQDREQATATYAGVIMDGLFA